MAQIWEGITTSSTLKAPELAIRHNLANAAKMYQWDEVFKILDSHPSLVNSWRPDGQSLFTALHQAAHAGASEYVIKELIKRGAWRSLKNAHQERPVDIAKNKRHRQLIRLLTPKRHIKIKSETIAQLEQHYHSLIKQRVAKLIAKESLRLPPLSILLELVKPEMWFPVPGMYGGFEYQLRMDDTESYLIVLSWMRIVEGSGQRHKISPQGIELIETGFV